MYGVRPGVRVLENVMTSNSNLNSEGSSHRHISGELNKIILQCYIIDLIFLIGQEKMIPRERS